MRIADPREEWIKPSYSSYVLRDRMFEVINIFSVGFTGFFLELYMGKILLYNEINVTVFFILLIIGSIWAANGIRSELFPLWCGQIKGQYVLLLKSEPSSSGQILFQSQ